MSSGAGHSLRSSIKKWVYPLVSRVVTKATWAEGLLRGGTQPMRILFIHNCRFNEYVQSRTFEHGQAHLIRQQRVWLPSVTGFIRKQMGEVDLCVAVLPQHIQVSGDGLICFRGQEEVRQVIDTRGTWEEIRLRFSKKRRQITNNFSEKNGLDYRISRELKDFDLFYHRMHVPLIQRKYGSLSELDSYATLRAFFEKGFVLLVEKEGQAVASALSQLEDGAILFRRSGVLDGDESHIKGGAQTALYYFQLQYALAHGDRALDSLKTVPFLNDGVFCHKADWGAVTYRDDEASLAVSYVFGQPSESVVRYFEINPTVVFNDTRLIALVGNSSAQADDQESLSKRYMAPGLSGFVSISAEGLSDIIALIA